MGYTTGPYSELTSLPVPPRPTAAGAREIDFVTQRYKINETTGGYEHMRSTIQQVVLLVSGAIQRAAFNTPMAREATRQRLFAALSSLTSSKPPKITDLVITVANPSAGMEKTTIEFRDVTTGLSEEVQL